ncbi:hypothetical protein GCM10010486_41370 [Nonomuraea roseoviolacea subsp. carminata]
MRSQDLIDERTVAEARLRSLTAPARRRPRPISALQDTPAARPPALPQDHPQPTAPLAPSIRAGERRHPYTHSTNHAAAHHIADVHPQESAPSAAGHPAVHPTQADSRTLNPPDDARAWDAARPHRRPHPAPTRPARSTDSRSLTAASWDPHAADDHSTDADTHVRHASHIPVGDAYAPTPHDLAQRPQNTVRHALSPHALNWHALSRHIGGVTETPGSDEVGGSERTAPAPPPSRPPLPPTLPPSFEAFRAAITAKAPALDPGRPGLRVLVLLAALAALAAGVFLWRSEPTPEPLPITSPTPQERVSRPTPLLSPTPTGEVTVHITGKVRKPGMYTLPMGARVADAVKAAGGVRQPAAASTVNLARRLIDGEQITVGAPGVGNPQAPPLTDPATTVLDLNTATPDQLEQLPGVGEVLAARIADFRTTHGGFTSVTQLQEIPGIGTKKYEELKDKVRI